MIQLSDYELNYWNSVMQAPVPKTRAERLQMYRMKLVDLDVQRATINKKIQELKTNQNA